MAQFKMAHMFAGDEIVINMDAVRTMHRLDDRTIISFDKGQDIIIKETIDQLLKSPELRNVGLQRA